MNTYQHISIGFCVAYDWHLLKHSLPLVYEGADQIFISYDSASISWSGKEFEMDVVAMKAMIANLDIASKITFIEGDYHSHSNHPGKNEIFQRMALSEHMSENQGWQLQFDTDEYLIEADYLFNKLRSWKVTQTDFNICLPWMNLFKKVRNGFLLIYPANEWTQVGSLNPHFEFGRRNGQKNIHVNAPILHQTWARPEQEIREKIANWGHSEDFDIEDFFKIWENLNEGNYHQLKDFHPIQPAVWPALQFVPVELSQINEQVMDRLRPMYPSAFSVLLKNNRYLSKARQLLNLR